MKKFDNLTRDDYSKIVNERINSFLEISNELLKQFVPLDSLKHYYIEYPPILDDKAHLKKCLMGTDGDKLGTLQRFYLMTYIVEGAIKFRAKDDKNSEMWVIFDRNFNWRQLNNENPSSTIDGNGGLRGTHLIKLVSLNGLHFPLAPSLTIKIDLDDKTVYNRSVATLISSLQPNSQVALLNLQLFDYKTMKIEIINNNPELKFDCSMVFV